VDRSLRPVEVGCADGGLCSWTVAISPTDGACAMRLTPTLPAGFAASSSEMLFSVNRPGLVALKGPGGAQTDHTPTYTWEMDPGASRYQLTVTDRATGMTVVNRTYDASDVCPCGDDCRVTPRDALTDGRFLWQLRPGDPDEWGTWRGMSFSLSAPLTPSNGTLGHPLKSTPQVDRLDVVL
jgi:hypothetical protein